MLGRFEERRLCCIEIKMEKNLFFLFNRVIIIVLYASDRIGYQVDETKMNDEYLKNIGR